MTPRLQTSGDGEIYHPSMYRWAAFRSRDLRAINQEFSFTVDQF